MSLSQERPENPAKFFLKIKNGAVQYYDKETQENVTVPTPFEFIVLDQLASITGWSDSDESDFWSNEVRYVGRDTLTVRTAKGMKDSGVWRDIKNNPSLSGTKYQSIVYLAHKSKEGLVTSRLALTGAALNAWIEFTSKHRLHSNKVILSGWEDAKKGSVQYKVPVFEAVPMTDEEKAEGIKLDKELQAYLREYFNYAPEHTAVETGVSGVDLFGKREKDEDEPINLDDIPF